jgi:DNA-binding winged helix-turn-helix (wHTH) protein
VRLRFDDLTYDSDRRQLWLGDHDVRLSTKAFELLALLIERRPNAVSKGDIHARLWPDTFVTDSSLPSLMSEVRDAIADHRREPRLLRTLHGFGYAFQAVGSDLADPSAEVVAALVGSGGDIALRAGENVLGRDGPDIVLLPSTSVSRRHARLVITAAGATVDDCGSKNGTFVDDRRVAGPTPVADGARLRFGSLLLTFRLVRPGATTDSVRSGPQPPG